MRHRADWTKLAQQRQADAALMLEKLPDVRKAFIEAGSRPAKYRNRVTIRDGFRFVSRLEARCYEELKLRRSAGELLWFIRQPSFDLDGGVRYRADFLAVRTDGGVEVIDAKGIVTAVGSIKLKQVEARYGLKVTLWRGR